MEGRASACGTAIRPSCFAPCRCSDCPESHARGRPNVLFSNLFLGRERQKNGEPGGPVRQKDLGRRGMQAQEPQEEGSLHPSIWGSACTWHPGPPQPLHCPIQPHGGAWLGLRRHHKEEQGSREWTAWKAGVPRRVVAFG